MERIRPLKPEEAPPGSRKLMESVQKKLGIIPNLMAALAHSPAALESYLNFSGAMSKGVLEPGLREQIALAVAGINGCDYCASAHTYLGKMAGVTEKELDLNLSGISRDSRTQAALSFARQVVGSRAHITDEDFDNIKNAGFSDAEIVEIILHVTLNITTNYFNHIAGTPIDFPVVRTHTQTA